MITRRQATTSFRYLASTDREAEVKATAILARAETNEAGFSLTIDGRRVVGGPVASRAASPCD